mmetsp:Transcript_30933/g.103100  ORF Transcript_30933/g.103100 Transcript_30933/m.103100 type:complete len:315 (+) Transcript_30933:64-1008(+)
MGAGPSSSAMGAGSSSSAELAAFRGGDDAPFDAVGFQSALAAWCKPYCLECSPPFLVGWYNEKRKETADGQQIIEAREDAVAFALWSIPGYLEVVADHFRRKRPTSNFVDEATDELLDFLRTDLGADLDAVVINTDRGPPYYHVQSVGCVAGVDEHIEAYDFTGAEAEAWREELSDSLEESRDTKMWGTDPASLRKIFGVNVHPVWGGWYAYRALVVLRGASSPALVKPPPLKCLEEKEAQRIIGEYNLRHAECLWRDLSADGHPADRRYTTSEYFFFTETSPAKRKRWLELRAAEMEQGVRAPGLASLASVAR